jgi:hypothetical protein
VNESAALALTPGSLDPRDFTGFPTMFPLVHGDIDTLETDDKVWISNLYPTAGFTSTTSNFTGTVRNAAAAPIDGIDIVCRDISDPRNSVITCVSGFTPGSTGTYEIPGLTPGNKYVLDFEQLRSSFIGGSRVGPLGAQLNLTAVGMPEFVNATGESMSDALGATSTFVAPAAMTSTALPDLTLNGAPGTLAIVETDPGALITSFHGDDITADVAVAVMAGSVLSITGSADQAEAGDLDFGSGDIEDYYFIDASTIPFPVEVFEVRVTPTGGAVDLYVISWDLGGGGSLSAAGSTAGGVGVAEEIDRHWEPTRFGSGGAADLMIIGVGTDTGGAIPYTLTVAATRMDTVGGSTVYADEPSTNGGTLFVNGSTNEIRGVNFSMTGGTPAVTTTDPQISVDSVAFVGSTQLDVMLSDAGSFVPGPVTLTITNPAAAGGSSGDITLIPALVPVELSVFETE